MARTVKPDEYASKRNEILDAALRLMFTKGYRGLTVQEILKEIRISSGAFHHYFDSRDDLVDAMVDRMLQEVERSLLPIICDPHRTAIEKLQGFFGTLDRIRIAHKADVVNIWRVWYADDNAVLRQKVDEAVLVHRAPLLAEIVRQGVREGVFTTAYPDQAGEVILSLVQGMGSTHGRLLRLATQASDGAAEIDEIVAGIVATHAAYMEAIERVLGAPPNCLFRADAEAAMVWVTAIRGAA